MLRCVTEATRDQRTRTSQHRGNAPLLLSAGGLDTCHPVRQSELYDISYLYDVMEV